MISTAQNPSPFDPLDHMPPDEGRFVVRERDPAGPGTMTEWARLRRNWVIRNFGEDASEEGRRRFEAEMRQCAEAERQALDWKELQAGQGGAATPALTEDPARSEQQLAELGHAKRREQLLRHLCEAAYHLAEAETLADEHTASDFHRDLLREIAMDTRLLSLSAGAGAKGEDRKIEQGDQP